MEDSGIEEKIRNAELEGHIPEKAIPSSPKATGKI